MICVSIAEPTLERCLRAVRGIEFGEVRIDKISGVNAEIVRKIFSRPGRLIATCRDGRVGDQKKYELLRAAVQAGASYVDVELGWRPALRAGLIRAARTSRCRVIISHHDFGKTPSRSALERIIRRSRAAGADIVKIACRVHSGADNARLLGLLDSRRPLVIIGLGGRGRITRIVAPLLGSPFSYASAAPGKEVAEGQIDRAALRKILGRLKEVCH